MIFTTITRKSFFAFLHDVAMAPVAWLLAYWLRLNLQNVPDLIIHDALPSLPYVVLIQAVVCWYFGLYRGVWRFSSVLDLAKIVKVAFLGAVLTFTVLFLSSHLNMVPRSIVPLYFILYTILLGGTRFVYRWSRDRRRMFNTKERIFIIGAGAAGESLVRDLLRGGSKDMIPVGFVDDNPRKKGRELHGIRVLGTTEDLKELVKAYSINMIMLAIPSIRSARMRELVVLCESLGLPFRTLPSVEDLAQGKVSIDAVRRVAIEDLLGRDPVQLDKSKLRSTVQDKVVLITGGGGSIGSELCRQVAQNAPSQLIIFEHSEFNLYKISQEISKQFPGLDFISLLVDVSDAKLVEMMLAKYRPELIFHAAAYKHVPLLESQVLMAVKNNINGTRNLANLAARYGVEKFVLVSTDKAVNPTNVMGLTKRIAEIYCQNSNAHSSTKFITVRFGNVLGSAGSVVPLFHKQIESGGPVTVTHKDMIRYFMTIKEAVTLILQSATMGQGGEIFVLDMGEPVSIQYLAEQMIQLSGLKVGEDIQIIYTGLRPGEKLFEELFHESERLVATQHNKISSALSRQIDWDDMLVTLETVDEAFANDDEDELLAKLMLLVPEFRNRQVCGVSVSALQT